MALVYFFFFLATYSIDEHLILLPEAPDWFLTAPQPFSSYGSLSRNTVTPVPKIPRVRCCLRQACVVSRSDMLLLPDCSTKIRLHRSLPWSRRLGGSSLFRRGQHSALGYLAGPPNSTWYFKLSSDEKLQKVLLRVCLQILLIIKDLSQHLFKC